MLSAHLAEHRRQLCVDLSAALLRRFSALESTVVARDEVGQIDKLIGTKIRDALGDCQRIVGVEVFISRRKEANLMLAQEFDEGFTGWALPADYI